MGTRRRKKKAAAGSDTERHDAAVRPDEESKFAQEELTLAQEEPKLHEQLDGDTAQDANPATAIAAQPTGKTPFLQDPDQRERRKATMGTASTWTPEELVEIARRRRVMQGCETLSDEEVLQMASPGEEEQFIGKSGLTGDEMAAAAVAEGRDGEIAAALLTGNVDFLRSCLSAGMDPNRRVLNTYATTLMCAIDAPCHNAVEKVIGCVQMLLTHRADPNLLDNHSRTAMHRAFENQLPAVVDLLLAGGAIAKRCSYGKCQKCTLQVKLALRRKPHPASLPVRAAREAAEKTKAEELQANSFDRVLEEEFGGGLDFSKLVEEEKAKEAAAADARRRP